MEEKYEPLTPRIREERCHSDSYRRSIFSCLVGLRADVIGIGSDRTSARVQGECFERRQSEIRSVRARSIVLQLRSISGSRGLFLGPLRHFFGKSGVVEGVVRLIREEGVSTRRTIRSDQAEMQHTVCWRHY